MTNDDIRRIFLSHGFTIKEGETDLKPYVYDAAKALIVEALAVHAADVATLVKRIREIVDLQREPHWAYRNTVTANRIAIRDLCDQLLAASTTVDL